MIAKTAITAMIDTNINKDRTFQNVFFIVLFAGKQPPGDIINFKLQVR